MSRMKLLSSLKSHVSCLKAQVHLLLRTSDSGLQM
jgi:hypothetical protein